MKKILITLLILFAVACTEKIAPAGENPKIKETEEFVKGQKVFMSTCNRCHPGGKGGLGPSIINKPGFVIRFQVRNGWGVMPSFDKKRLSPDDLDHLVSYLKDIR